MSLLISIVGTPSPTLYATLNVIRALVDITIGNHKVVVANSLEALKEKFPGRSARNGMPVVLLCDYPEPDMLATFHELKAPVVVCVDDFATVALYSVVSRGFGGVESARFATMGLVKVEPAVVSPPPVCLFVSDPKVETLERLIGRLAAFYHLPAKDNLAQKVLQFLGFAEKGEATLGEYADCKVVAGDKIEKDGRDALEKRSPLEKELIDFLAPQYDAVAQGRRLERLDWPVYALLRPEFPDRLTIGPIDLTGPARYIYYGPYFALPAGAWCADISFEVQDCWSDNEVGIDITAGKVLSMVKAALPPHGVYGCQIRFQIEDPSKPVEIRMQLLTGAIEGVIQLHRIAIHRLDSLDQLDDEAA